MNRRSFLKALSAIPLAGSLAVVGPAVASEDSPESWLRTPEEYEKVRRDAGLDEAFVYGGRLFKVFNRTIETEDYHRVILQVRYMCPPEHEDFFTVRMWITKEQFEDHPYLMAICWRMLKELEERVEMFKKFLAN